MDEFIIAWYRHVFETYLDTNVLILRPDKRRDPFAEYIQHVLDDSSTNYLCKTDESWRDTIFDALMDMYVSIHSLIVKIESIHDDERQLCEEFDNGDIDKKRELWPKVYNHLKHKYSSRDLDIEGDIEFFAMEGYKKKAILETIANDWRNAEEAKRGDEISELIEQQQQQFENNLQRQCQKNFRQRREFTDCFYKYPALQSIVDVLGRKQPGKKGKDKSRAIKDMPVICQHAKAYHEVDGVDLGNCIQSALPSELVYISSRLTEDVFFHKYATNRLQIMSSKPPVASPIKTPDEHPNPRPIKGPVVVAIDTSGSMSGRNEMIAKSLVLQIVKMTQRQRRQCFIISFSYDAIVLDVSKTDGYNGIKEFLTDCFTGGSDGNQMLREINKILDDKNFSMADTLIISDFEWYTPQKENLARRYFHKKQGTRYYGLDVAYGSSSHRWLDGVWTLDGCSHSFLDEPLI